jgi:hypothetical protein
MNLQSDDCLPTIVHMCKLRGCRALLGVRRLDAALVAGGPVAGYF